MDRRESMRSLRAPGAPLGLRALHCRHLRIQFIYLYMDTGQKRLSSNLNEAAGCRRMCTSSRLRIPPRALEKGRYIR